MILRLNKQSISQISQKHPLPPDPNPSRGLASDRRWRRPLSLPIAPPWSPPAPAPSSNRSWAAPPRRARRPEGRRGLVGQDGARAGKGFFCIPRAQRRLLPREPLGYRRRGGVPVSQLVPTGTSVLVEGEVKKLPEGAKQSVELRVEKVLEVDPVDPAKYPIPKSWLTLEFLRDFVHLHASTDTISAIARIRDELAYATHTFSMKNGFRYIHTPIITPSDCEGAGDMFQQYETGVDAASYKSIAFYANLLVSSMPFEHISYTKDVQLLSDVTDRKFENKVDYLREMIFKKPVIVYNYPQGIKAFYMRLNDDQKTIAAMDVLVPEVGGLTRGSQREERLDILVKRCEWIHMFGNNGTHVLNILVMQGCSLSLMNGTLRSAVLAPNTVGLA
ncbi:hypothetical protein ZIOFF_006593 [Zingiber officinale]|uniref:Aminoacyl-tRNA synthetase class II (D/K/N) domain-containing protein n=1 Tax=Zingiber officinale TaxID=94328 RepID=A0A8J5HNW8_ZINOF|nr:hypothetical protein ZIOFF_006593 [Zingiber officinale]